MLVIDLFRNVRSGSQTDAVRDSIDRFVVVGVPDRYMQER
jgi:hypothetical protein